MAKTPTPKAAVTHADGTKPFTHADLQHITSCDKCRALYGSALSGWEHK